MNDKGDTPYLLTLPIELITNHILPLCTDKTSSSCVSYTHIMRRVNRYYNKYIKAPNYLTLRNLWEEYSHSSDKVIIYLTEDANFPFPNISNAYFRLILLPFIEAGNITMLDWIVSSDQSHTSKIVEKLRYIIPLTYIISIIQTGRRKSGFCSVFEWILTNRIFELWERTELLKSILVMGPNADWLIKIILECSTLKIIDTLDGSWDPGDMTWPFQRTLSSSVEIRHYMKTKGIVVPSKPKTLIDYGLDMGLVREIESICGQSDYIEDLLSYLNEYVVGVCYTSNRTDIILSIDLFYINRFRFPVTTRYPSYYLLKKREFDILSGKFRSDFPFVNNLARCIGDLSIEDEETISWMCDLVMSIDGIATKNIPHFKWLILADGACVNGRIDFLEWMVKNGLLDERQVLKYIRLIIEWDLPIDIDKLIQFSRLHPADLLEVELIYMDSDGGFCYDGRLNMGKLISLRSKGFTFDLGTLKKIAEDTGRPDILHWIKLQNSD